MNSFSVIVTAHNNEAVIGRALDSIEASIAFFRKAEGGQDTHAEIVVVEDGSTDQTWPIVQRQAQGKSLYKPVRRS